MNQVLASVGAGVSWREITDVLPQTRTTQTFTATAGQTAFSFNYNVNYLDVFVNGVKLTGVEFTATNGTSITISEALFAGDIVEFFSYAVAGSGSGTVSSSNDLSDITLTGAQNNDILVYDGSAFRNQQSLNLSGNIAAADLTLSGNLTVNGTQTVLNTATLTVDDLNITLADGAADSSAADGAGITIDGADATFNYSHSGTKWVANKSIEATSFIGNVTGDASGNAATATALETARTIGGVSFDGSANINLPGVNASGTQDTSGNAATATALATARTIAGVSFDGTSNISLNNNAITNGAGYITTSHAFTNTNQLTNGAGFITASDDITGNAATATALANARTIAGVSFDGTSNISLNNNAITNGAGYITTSHAFTNTNQLTNGAGFITASDDISGNAATATALETARTIGGVSFDGSANINLPGVNASGTQDTSGNAATATALATARTIGGVSFDGSANINLPGVNATGNQDTSGNAATATALANARTIAGVSFDGTSNISLNNNAITNGAGYITSSGTAALAQGLTGTPDISVGSITATSFSGDGSGLTGVASTDNIQTATEAVFLSGVKITGVTTATGGVVGNLTGDVTGDVTGNVTGDVTGNADTATALATARTIGGVSFDGSANINLPGVNAAGNQNTTGTAAGLTGTPNVTVGVVTATDLTLSGNLTVNGTTTTLNTATLSVEDLNITLASGASSSSDADGAGLTVAGASATFNYSHSGTKWVANKSIEATSFLGDATGLTGTPNLNVGVITATSLVGDVTGDVTGNVSGSSGSCTGNAATATSATTAGTVTTAAQPNITSLGTLTGLTVNGTVAATDFNSTSDITLKDNVSIIDNALDMINNLNGISWNWKHDGKASLGVSAQNVETVAPELVNTGETHKSVNYNGLIGILIEAVKEQGNQISELRSELAKKANSRRKRS